MNRIIKIIATMGGLGYSRVAPGTTGCLGAAAIYLLVRENFAAYAVVTAVLFVAGFLVSGRAEETFGQKDAKAIVIDDGCGLLLALFLIPCSLANLIVAFLIFRTMDIIKPFPIKRIEGLTGSLGIMGDDILAGIYTNILFRFLLVAKPF
jgi:phosphatidylglycerophosphatase A